MARKTTHIRVEKDIWDMAQVRLPLYTSREIYKAGVISLMAYNKAGEFILGNVWKTKKK